MYVPLVLQSLGSRQITCMMNSSHHHQYKWTHRRHMKQYTRSMASSSTNTTTIPSCCYCYQQRCTRIQLRHFSPEQAPEIISAINCKYWQMDYPRWLQIGSSVNNLLLKCHLPVNQSHLLRVAVGLYVLLNYSEMHTETKLGFKRWGWAKTTVSFSLSFHSTLPSLPLPCIPSSVPQYAL